MKYHAKYQDFVETLVEADERINARNGTVLPWKPKVGKAWVELPWNLAGSALGGLLNVLPAKIHHGVWHGYLSRAPNPKRLRIGADFQPAMERAAAISHRLEAEDGREPAVLMMISHPPSDPKGIELNMELLAACFDAARKIRGRVARMRFVLAIDAHALDAVSLPIEGLYTGLVNTNQIGVDRQSHLRSWLQRRFVLPEISVQGVTWRLSRLLHERSEVAMALSGGVYATGRLLYCLREWLWALRRDASGENGPREVVTALREVAGFTAFVDTRVDPQSAARRHWGVVESWLLSRVSEKLMHDSGVIDAEVEDSLTRIAVALGFETAAAERRVAAFKREFGRSVPYRERLFWILSQRVINRGTPLLLLGMDHGDWDSPETKIARPVGMLPADNGEIRLLEWDRGSVRERRQPVADFAREWVSSIFD